MSEPTPQKSDATLGGKAPPPATGAILGGLAGARQRLESETLVARRAALVDALQYGEQGAELVIQALNALDEKIQRATARILRDQGGEEGKKILLEHEPLSYFTTLADWRFESYNSRVGVTDPKNNAYVVRMTTSGRSGSSSTSPERYDLSQFKALIEDLRVKEVEALVFKLDSYYWDYYHAFGVALKALLEAKSSFPNLIALSIGANESDYSFEFRTSELRIFGVRSLLESFPKLEVLQVFGCFGGYDIEESYTLECEGLRHEHLKTLIIETSDITQANIAQICSIDLPELEYFELWFGRKRNYDSARLPLAPIFAGKVYPKLRCLGLCSSEEADALLLDVIGSPLIDQLAVLNLKMGTLADLDIEPLLIEPLLDISFFSDLPLPLNLKVLDISGNNLSRTGLAQLRQQPYQTISTCQFSKDEYGYYTNVSSESLEGRILDRHSALYG